MPPVVVLLTDFGLTDPYVGVMKGVMLHLFPTLTLVDLSHGVPPQDVRTGALFLESAWRYFSEGTVFLCVVDPGVGGPRRPMILRSAGRLFVGPDNGLLSLLPDGDWWEISVEEPLASRTFHGRDLFAPVAAKLAMGTEPGRLGRPVSDPQRLSLPEAFDGEGEILYFDGYGNAITSLRGIDVGEVEVADRRLPVRLSYGAVAAGQPLALTGSTGRLELAVRNGSAQAELALEVGMSVRVHAWK